MAWTTPRTWTDGEKPNAAMFNAHLRDNLNEVSPAAREVKLGAISVLDHGAVADWNGSTGTNNTAAFNAAIAAAPEGGTVIVPPGRYYFASTVNMNNTVDLTCGAGGMISGPTGTQLVFAAGVSGIRVEQAEASVRPAKWRIGPFRITSLSTEAGSDVGIFINAGRGVVDTPTVESFGSHGIHLKAGAGYGDGNANNTTVLNPRAYGNRGDGIRLEGTDANACLVIKPDVVANYGWGVNIVSASMCKIIAAHADQQYNDSPGAYRDAGNSNDWDWPYVEGGSVFLMDTGSSNGRLSCSMYGAPTVQHTGSVHLTWTIRVFKGAWHQNFVSEAGDQQYRVSAGGVALDSFDILNVTSGNRIASVNASGTRWQSFLNIQPNATDTLDLGSASVRWRNGYFSSFVRVGTFATGSRPSASSAGVGAMVYDTTLGKPIWSTGSVWKDAAGTTV